MYLWSTLLLGLWTEHCGEVPEVPNSQRYGTENGVGEYVLFYCNAGYDLEGPGRVNCQGNKQWSRVPVCILGNCGEFPEVENSVLIGSANKVGEYVVFICSRGYEIEGPHVVTCLSNRIWSSLPTCRESATTCPTVTSPTVTCPTCPTSPVVTCPTLAPITRPTCPSVNFPTLTQSPASGPPPESPEKLSNLTFKSGISSGEGINYVKRQNKSSELRFLVKDDSGYYQLGGKFSDEKKKLFPEFILLKRNETSKQKISVVYIKYEEDLFADTYDSVDCYYLARDRWMGVALNSHEVVEINFFAWFKQFAAISEEGNLCGEDDYSRLSFYSQLNNKIIFPNLNYQTVRLGTWILDGHFGSFSGDCVKETPKFHFKCQKLFRNIRISGFCFNYLTSGLENAAVLEDIYNEAVYLICAAESCHIISYYCTYENSTTRADMKTGTRYNECSEEQCQTMVRNKATTSC